VDIASLKTTTNMHPPAPTEKKKQPPFAHPLFLSTNTNPHQNKAHKTKKEAGAQKTLHHHFQNKRKHHHNTPKKFRDGAIQS
jgi:hypothetical protein